MSQAAPFDRVAESLLAFWAEAGVDAMLHDTPIDRIEAGICLYRASRDAPLNERQRKGARP